MCVREARQTSEMYCCVSGRRDRQVKCIVVCQGGATDKWNVLLCVSGRRDRQVKCIVMCVREARQTSEMYCYVCQGGATDK